jgi:hypothetical protein
MELLRECFAVVLNQGFAEPSHRRAHKHSQRNLRCLFALACAGSTTPKGRAVKF